MTIWCSLGTILSTTSSRYWSALPLFWTWPTFGSADWSRLWWSSWCSYCCFYISLHPTCIRWNGTWSMSLGILWVSIHGDAQLVSQPQDHYRNLWTPIQYSRLIHLDQDLLVMRCRYLHGLVWIQRSHCSLCAIAFEVYLKWTLPWPNPRNTT